MKIAVVRGTFLNRYEMQFYEPLARKFDITAFGSLRPYHEQFAFPVHKLLSPMDIPDFPYKMPVLNRLFVDAHYLFGLEDKLKGFDIVHTAETYFHYTQQCLNAKKRGYVKKVIVTVLENIPFNNEGIWGRKEFKNRARNELDHIIALTTRTKAALLLEGADEKKITVISHFVDTKRFVPTQNKKDSDSLTILFSGRLETYKGIYELLYAAKFLLSDPVIRQKNLSFIFVGDGSQKNKFIELEKKLGIQKYISHKSVSYDDMPSMYQKADIYVAPSKATDTWQEQYNTTLLEAQASGLPIVTTASGGIVENVGGAALLVQPADVVSLADALKQFIINPKLRKEYSVKARKRAQTIHDVSIGAKKLAHVYETLMR